MSRTGYAIKNVFVGVGGQFFSILIGLVTRIFFVRLLAQEYLGLNGLFSSILTTLSFVELGIGPAIVYSLYKPLAERDNEQVNALMNLFRKSYIAIGVAVAAIGIALTPFLPYLIEDIPENIPHINAIYILFVVNTSISYFFSYKKSLIIADQRQYIVTACHYVFYFIMNALQIGFLYFTRSYFVYLVIMILSTFMENIVISQIASRKYPAFLSGHPCALRNEYKNEIIINIKAIILHKLGTVIHTVSDNLIMGKFFGLVSVAIYSNYLLIITPLNAIGGQIFSFTASLGNLKVTSEDDHAIDVFRIMEFVDFWVYAFFSVCLFVLFNPFIAIAFGENFLFPMFTVALIVLSFYLDGRRKALLSIKEGYGIFYPDRYKPLVEVTAKVLLSIGLAIPYGINGVFLGGILSRFVCIVVEPYVVYKYGLGWQYLSSYVKRYIMYFAVFVALTIVTYIAASLCGDGGLLPFVGKMMVCLVFPNIVIFLLFRKTTEFAWVWNTFKKFMKKIKK